MFSMSHFSRGNIHTGDHRNLDTSNLIWYSLRTWLPCFPYLASLNITPKTKWSNQIKVEYNVIVFMPNGYWLQLLEEIRSISSKKEFTKQKSFRRNSLWEMMCKTMELFNILSLITYASIFSIIFFFPSIPPPPPAIKL